MKIPAWLFTMMTTAALVLIGCGKPSSVDTSALEKSFKSAEATLQTSADKALAALKARDYTGAMAELKALASNAKVTPEQKQAIKDVMAQVEKLVADATAKAKNEAGKAMEDLKKSLPK
jgi:outer membrane protein assembly factor BamD (BamD/ComL family)